MAAHTRRFKAPTCRLHVILLIAACAVCLADADETTNSWWRSWPSWFGFAAKSAASSAADAVGDGVRTIGEATMAGGAAVANTVAAASIAATGALSTTAIAVADGAAAMAAASWATMVAASLLVDKSAAEVAEAKAAWFAWTETVAASMIAPPSDAILALLSEDDFVNDGISRLWRHPSKDDMTRKAPWRLGTLEGIIIVRVLSPQSPSQPLRLQIRLLCPAHNVDTSYETKGEFAILVVGITLPALSWVSASGGAGLFLRGRLEPLSESSGPSDVALDIGVSAGVRPPQTGSVMLTQALTIEYPSPPFSVARLLIRGRSVQFEVGSGVAAAVRRIAQAQFAKKAAPAAIAAPPSLQLEALP